MKRSQLNGAFFLLLLSVTLVAFVSAFPTNSTETPEDTTTPAIERDCSSYSNATGDGCTPCISAKGSCYYCKDDKSCHSINDWRIWKLDRCSSISNTNLGSCTLNFQSILILVGVGAGIFLVLLITLCCCCCCKKKNYGFSKQDKKWEREREERKVKQEEKRKERQSKTDEIRRKYGLIIDAASLIKDENPYQRFDN